MVALVSVPYPAKHRPPPHRTFFARKLRKVALLNSDLGRICRRTAGPFPYAMQAKYYSVVESIGDALITIGGCPRRRSSVGGRASPKPGAVGNDLRRQCIRDVVLAIRPCHEGHGRSIGARQGDRRQRARRAEAGTGYALDWRGLQNLMHVARQ